jgi:hypothetical protein
MVLEFQHSPLRRNEREARENFYQKMVWVVDGLARVRDRKRFFASLAKDSKRDPIVKEKPLTYSVRSNEGALLRDWVDSRKPVFFDFGDNNEFGDLGRFRMPLLWRLDPHSPNGEAHLSPVTRTSFRDRCLKRMPLKGIDYTPEVRGTGYYLPVKGGADIPLEFTGPPRLLRLIDFDVSGRDPDEGT